jgi:hypothetical protein
MHLNGEFQITGWDEKILSENGEQKDAHASITQSYSGDIVGSSTLNYLMHYVSPSLAHFSGFERIECQLDGHDGAFAIQHTGEFKNGVASSQFVVIQNSGSGACAGFSGQGEFTSTKDGKADYKIEISQ